MLESALVAGLLSVGIHVYKLGVLATPAVAYLVKTEGASAGVMISASHNPALDNGIKFFGGDGFKLDDEKKQKSKPCWTLPKTHFLVRVQRAWEPWWTIQKVCVSMKATLFQLERLLKG